MTLDPVSVVFLIVGFQSLLFCLFLISSGGQKKLSNRILAAFLLTLSAQMTALFAEFTSAEVQKVLNYMCVFGYTYGPLLYLYTLSLVNKDFTWQKNYWLHFIIPSGFVVSGLLGFPLCSKIGSLLYLSLVVYITLGILEIQRYRKVIAQTQSADLLSNLQWLQWTMVIFCAILFSDIIDRFIVDLDFFLGISIVHFSLLFFVNWIFYKGLKQPHLFQGITYEEKAMVITLPTANLNEEDAAQLAQKLKEYMETYQPFTDSELTLSQLAELLEVSPRRLSRVINSHLKQNFIGFINNYRLKMAKERLANPKDAKETVLEVMYEVGFKSKSSFNTLFKAQTGQTPTAFKKAHSAK